MINRSMAVFSRVNCFSGMSCGLEIKVGGGFVVNNSFEFDPETACIGELQSRIITDAAKGLGVAAMLAAGCYTSDSALLGAKVGAAWLGGCLLPASSFVSLAKQQEITDDMKKYMNRSTPFSFAIEAPVLEELIFRVGLQSCLFPAVINAIAPSAHTSAISLGLTAATFGAIHLIGGSGFERQACFATVTGLVYGALYNTAIGLTPGLPDITHLIGPPANDDPIAEVKEEPKKSFNPNGLIASATAHSVNNLICSIGFVNRFFNILQRRR